MEEPKLVALNANRHRTNIVPTDERDGIMKNTIDEIVNLLLDHCGPKSSFAMIVQSSRPDIPPKFTCDGINIVRNLQYYNPMQSIMRNELMHIGASVERAAGDGTTSAMIISGLAYSELSQRNLYTDLSYQDIIEAYSVFKQWMINYLKTNSRRFSNTERNNGIQDVAYHQAFTSSHGDEELAEQISNVFASVPEEAWRNITFVQTPNETKNIVTIDEEDDQFVLESQPLLNNVLNHRAGTEYDKQEVNIVVIDEPLSLGSPISQATLNYIKKLKEKEDESTKHPILLICPYSVDSSTASWYSQKAMDQFDIFLHRTRGMKYNDLMGLQAIADKKMVTNTEDVTHFTANVTWKSGKMRFNEIYELPEGYNDPMHPAVDRKNSILRIMLDEIDETINVLKVDAMVDTRDAQELKRLQNLYNRMKYRSNKTIKVGGSGRNNQHAADVVTDVLMAVKNSLTNGYLPGGNLGLMYGCNEFINTEHCCDNIDIVKSFANAFLNATEVVIHRLLNEDTPGELSYLLNQRNDLWSSIAIISNHDVDNLTIEPRDVSITILETFGDVFLKYLKSARIIAIGTIYVDEANVNKKK